LVVNLQKQAAKNPGAFKKAAAAATEQMPDISKFRNKFKATEKYHYPGGFKDEITKREAGQILGVSPSSKKERIRDAHRRLMLSGIHPDKGGSALLTTKINEAKDILLKNKR
jgi:hypothetical protein